MTAIVHVHGRQILDSRGNPTVEVDVSWRTAASAARRCRPAPRPARMRRWRRATADKDRYLGKGVAQAVEAVNGELARRGGSRGRGPGRARPAMIELDGTDNKGRLGANAILGVSLAVAKAAADARGLPLYRYVGGVAARTLPVPMMNIINGGAHADNPIDFQEFMILPVGAPNFAEALRCGAEIFHTLKKGLHDAGLNTNVGDEGGFAPNLASARDALDFIMRSVEQAGYKPGDDVMLALDCAATEFFKDGAYRLDGEGQDAFARRDGGLSRRARESYPIASIEDGMAEDDLDGWKALTDRLGGRIQLVGDDVFVTNPARLAMGIERGLANSILVKVNQIGTLTETLERSRWRTGPATPRSCRTAPARPRTRPSPTSPSPPIAGRSRPAASPAPIASPSTTSC
jgi:enolase